MLGLPRSWPALATWPLPPDHQVVVNRVDSRARALSPALTSTAREMPAVGNQAELAPESAARVAQCVVFWLTGLLPPTFLEAPAAARLARIELPSTHHRFQSMWPFWSRRIRTLPIPGRINHAYANDRNSGRPTATRRTVPEDRATALLLAESTSSL
jgi:hypothetical protein